MRSVDINFRFKYPNVNIAKSIASFLLYHHSINDCPNLLQRGKDAD